MSEENEEQARLNDITPLQMGAHQMHEVYMSHISAGFNPQQALWLLAAQVTGCPGRYPPEASGEA